MNIIVRRTLLSASILSIMPIMANAQTDKDSVNYDLKLDTVHVTARRPIIKTEGSKDIVHVKGSYLGKLGNLGNMLVATPGISTVGQNMYEVVGKGAPKYYVDGREVTSQDIFKTIKSSNIDRIEIEREPGGKYPAGTNAVINIITIRPLTDRISLDLYNTATFKRKVSDNPSFEFKANKGVWTSSLTYDYGTYGNLNKETYFTEIAHPDYTFRSDESNNNYMRSFSHTVTFANDINFSPNHRLSLVYNYAHEKEHTNDTETLTYKDRTKTTLTDVIRKEDNLSNQNTFSMSYTGKTGKNSYMFLSADYSIIDNDTKYTSDETNRQTLYNNYSLTNNDGKYNLATVNLAYNFALPYKIGAETGGRYYNTHHSLHYATSNKMATNDQQSNHQVLDDNVSAAYLTLQRSWKNVWASIGGRYEYSDTKINIDTKSNSYKASRHTSDFLPSASVVWTPKQGLRFQAHYKRSIQRQGYMGLVPFSVYKDSLSYTSGNTQLLPGYTDTYSFYTTWKSLTLGFIYSHTTNEISNVTYNPDQNTDIVCEMPLNMNNSDSYQIFASYRKSFGKLFFSGTASMQIPRFSYKYLGQTCKASKVSCSGNANLSYFISSTFTAFTNFSFQSYNERLNRIQKAANNWMAGLQANLLDDCLSISLTFTDILHKANYNNLDYRYMNTREGTYGSNDMRGISLSLSYSLFNQNLKVKGSRNDQEVINRTM